MVSRRVLSLCLASLLASQLVLGTLAASMDAQEARKILGKPGNNALVKEAKEPLKKEEGFNWGKIAGTVLQILIGGPTSQSANPQEKTTSDYINELTTGDFSWSKVVSLGLHLILSVVGGGPQGDGIDRVDGAPSPVEGILTAVISYLTGSKDPNEVGIMAKQATELFGLVVTLLDALRTSFSQRSFEARSLGSSDPVSDAAVAGATMLKSYVLTYQTEDDVCMQKFLCEANRDCVHSTGDTGYLFCQIGTYGMSYMLEKTTYTPFEIYNDAGRRGRVGEDCVEVFSDCNDV